MDNYRQDPNLPIPGLDARARRALAVNSESYLEASRRAIEAEDRRELARVGQVSFGGNFPAELISYDLSVLPRNKPKSPTDETSQTPQELCTRE